MNKILINFECFKHSITHLLFLKTVLRMLHKSIYDMTGATGIILGHE